MNRAQALDYLTNEFGALASDAGLTVADTGAGYGQAIDNALRRLEYDESELTAADVDAADVPDYIALLEYFSLRRFARVLAVRVDILTGDPTTSLKRSQAFAQVQALLAEAKAEVAGLGLAGEQMQTFRLNLDFLDPRRE